MPANCEARLERCVNPERDLWLQEHRFEKHDSAADYAAISKKGTVERKENLLEHAVHVFDVAVQAAHENEEEHAHGHDTHQGDGPEA